LDELWFWRCESGQLTCDCDCGWAAGAEVDAGADGGDATVDADAEIDVRGMEAVICCCCGCCCRVWPKWPALVKLTFALMVYLLAAASQQCHQPIIDYLDGVSPLAAAVCCWILDAGSWDLANSTQNGLSHHTQTHTTPTQG
jgi:hypothetical protein